MLRSVPLPSSPSVNKRSIRTKSNRAVLAALLVALATPALAQHIPTPKEKLGFNIGDDYHLATYTQLVDYWNDLAAASPRMVLEEIGKTAEGRPQLMAIITSPENHKHLARYKEISARLAHAEGLTEDEARALAAEGKAVIWIDGGLHATEVLGAHQLMEWVYQMVSRNDPETLRFLNDVVLLAVHANPDGMELVSNWYMRESDPLKRSTSGIPRLYQKYVGHDNNRDFFLVSQPETENMNRIMFHEWFPQIVYNHHQTGPAGTIMFAPPFRDPFNYTLDPLVPLGIEMVGAAMHSRFVAEGKGGTTMRSGSGYSTWWNGGLRTITYFHNMIGLLTETKGNPTPIDIEFLPDNQLPHNDLPLPIKPQKWHFRQSIEYEITANRAVMDYASRYRETLLYNLYLMGRNSIQRGSEDHWTIHPKRIEAVKLAAKNDQPAGNQRFRRARGVPQEYYESVLHDPALRDPRGYILPAGQPDFPTATKFVNALIKNGITIDRATRDFEVAGKRYPKGSYVVKTAQAFRPHILDMFEPQDHPNDFAYPGGPPIPPYDNAGWTLALQMGVEFDRILDGFDGPFEKIDGLAKPIPGTVANARSAAGFLLSHAVNDGFVATNRLMAAGENVYWISETFRANGKTYPAGTIYIDSRSSTASTLRRLATNLGVSFDGVGTSPRGNALKMRPTRVGLWDRYGGSMPSGWARWLLEQYEFPFEVVYPQTLDAGNLAKKFDVLVFVNGAIPSKDSGRNRFRRFGTPPDSNSVPVQYRDRLGSITADKTVPQLLRFLNDGGTMIAIGSSTNMAYFAGLPVQDYLLDSSGKPLPQERYYMPGSLHRIAVDNTQPVAYGLADHIIVHFNNSPVFKLSADAAAKGVHRLGWFDSDEPLVSGWAWGQKYLKGGTTLAAADVGRGKLYLFGPEIIRRGQPHGSFKLLLNAIYLGGATNVRLQEAAGGSN
ncbi:MAG: M14 metallopeptidase family protein [Gemmatimonadales bacterium]